MKGSLRILPGILLLTIGMSGSGLFAESKPESAVTTDNPAIPVDELELRLNPLTRSELVVEADGWLKLLQARVQEISTAEIGVKHQREELAMADEVQETLDDVEEAKRAVREAPVDEDAAEDLKEAEKKAEKTLTEATQAVRKLSENKEVADISRTATEQARKKAEQKGETDKEQSDEGRTKRGDTEEARQVFQRKGRGTQRSAPVSQRPEDTAERIG